MKPEALSASPNSKRFTLPRFLSGIGTKIILPFFLLTLAVAGIGTYVVTNLVTGSLQERFNNQLLDAGRVVSDSMVFYEDTRLQTLRTVAGTVGIPQGVADNDGESLASLVPQIVAISNNDAVELLDMEGKSVYGWQRLPGQPGNAGQEHFSGFDFSGIAEVRLVLNGVVDELGDKRVFLGETENNGYILFTVGPIFDQGQQVGVVMIGTYIRRMMIDLTLNAVARVTLYDQNGRVLDTTLGGVESTGETTTALAESTQALEAIVPLYDEIVQVAQESVPLTSVTVSGQEYVLAYGDWRLRGQSFGVFSVGLPSNFILTAAATSRNQFSLIFTISTMAVFTIGFVIANSIIRPLNRLVETSVAVADGDLERRSGIEGRDEIAQLAHSFDVMTDKLAQRNYELRRQASELEAILFSIADGVLVLDNDEQIVTLNAMAQQLLADMAQDFSSGPMRMLTFPSVVTPKPGEPATIQPPQRYQIGNRVLSALAAPITTPDGHRSGTVVVLRDITRDVEAEHLKDAFITSISHELRTPLTVIKVYTDLMLKTANGKLDDRQLRFVQNITKGTDQLEHHINQLINISEIQAGTLSKNWERIDLRDLVQKTAENWREPFESKGLTFSIKLPADALWVKADKSHLSWALDNLLRNSHNYTLSGGQVKITVFKENNEARLDVIDSGIGIAAADQPYLFNRFFRANNALNYDVRGVGLGLFIAKSVVDMHQGRIWAKSELGVGSTFSIALSLEE